MHLTALQQTNNIVPTITGAPNVTKNNHVRNSLSKKAPIKRKESKPKKSQPRTQSQAHDYLLENAETTENKEGDAIPQIELGDTNLNCQFVKLENRTYFEHFDTIALLKLLSHPAVTESVDCSIEGALKDYVRNSQDGMRKVTYKRAEHGFGRLYAKGRSSLQSLPRRIRHTVAGHLYWDIDICNCHPTILSQLCRKHGIAHPYLEQYVVNRDSMLEETSTHYNVNRGDAKGLFIRILCGGTYYGWASELVIKQDATKNITDFQTELTRIQNAIWDKYENIQKVATQNEDKNYDNPKGSLLSIVLDIEEDKILSEIVKFEERNYGRVIDVLIFDGCQIRRDNKKPMTMKELEECEGWIAQETGYHIKLAEKPMSDCYNLDQCKPLLHLICKNESDAAIALKRLHEGDPETISQSLSFSLPFEVGTVIPDSNMNKDTKDNNSSSGSSLIKFCDNMLFVYDKETGLWNSDEIAIHQQFLKQYKVEMGDWLETVREWTKLYTMLKTQNGDPMFLERVNLTSLGKLLFKNGFYDFETKVFSTQFDAQIFFPFRIERNYNALRNEAHVTYVNLTLFVLPFATRETGIFVKKSLARAIAGCIRDKRLYFNIGPPNASKGVLTDALSSCYGPYIGTFNGGILQVSQGDKDTSLRFKEYFESRYCRIMISNEIPMCKGIDGVILKIISSGGDKITGRKLHLNNSKFISHSTTIINGNDRPRIIPADDALVGRTYTTPFSNSFDIDASEDGTKTNTLPFNVEAYLEWFFGSKYGTHLNINNAADDSNTVSTFKSEQTEVTSSLTTRFPADEKIKERIQEQWFQDALFHIISDAYCNNKAQPSNEVLAFTKCWNSADDFKENLLQAFEVTTSKDDIVTNKEIVAWSEVNGFKISATKIGIEMSKIKGIEKVAKSNGAQYMCLRQRLPF
jgi:hypothetical protein